MPETAFVILHYLAIEETIKCIDSLKRMISPGSYRIVVVDNGSENGTGIRLAELFKTDEYVTVICLEKNLGFSSGNNVGYRYAREKLHSEFIVVMNNDTVMIQSDFLDKAANIYQTKPYYVLGPDIVNLEGVHQSPQRDHIITEREVRKWLIKRFSFSVYLHLHRLFRLPDSFVIYKKYIQHDRRRREGLKTDKTEENVELQGACFIFSPLFTEKNEEAFEELTFMYGEETLLSLRCMENGWPIVYDPSLQILHAERVSTGQVSKTNIDKEIFWSDNHVKAINAILKRMRRRRKAVYEKN